MKNIFYICTKPIRNWDVFIPPEHIEEAQAKISVLIINQDQELNNIHVSHVWTLNQDKSNVLGFSSIKNISSQHFLEQIFLNDLSMVI